jgi:hypothetical protein
LELERIRRRAAEDLAAERAHTIQTLESALRALQAQHAAPAPNPRPRRFLPSAIIRRHLHSRAGPPARLVADGAEAKAGQAPTQPGGKGGHHRTGAEQAAATKAALSGLTEVLHVLLRQAHVELPGAAVVRSWAGLRTPKKVRKLACLTVEYFFYCRGRPGTEALLEELAEAHWSFMDRYGEAMIARGRR